MKKQFLLLGIGIILPVFMSAQGGNIGNLRLGTNFLGFNAGFSGPLDIRNDFNDRINFSTNTFTRHIIDNGGGGNNGGRALFSNDATAVAPQARLHLHQTGGAVSMLFNNSGIGTTGNDGLVIGISTTGDAFFINNELGQNFSWYNQGGGGPGTLLGRMRLYDGGVGQATGRLAISNDLPNAFVAVDRHTLYESIATGSVQTRYQNTATGVTATDGYAVGVDNANGVVNHTQFEKREMRWLAPNVGSANAITEWMRLENNKTNTYVNGSSTDGYIGLNNPNPTFHIDGTTPSFTGGELFTSFRISDAIASRMGMVNAAQLNNVMQPTFFGNIDSTQKYTALQTVGAIKANQDTSTNTQAITRFISGREWKFNIQGIQSVNEVTFRNLFSWHNGNVIKMHMTAQGRLRIGTNLSTTASPPRNRIEITASPIDPYGQKIATNGASGLRFTHLTSAKTPVPKDTNGVDLTKVLSVDSAGNVVLINGGGNADNGLSISGPTAGRIHLGQNVGATGNPGKLLNNREVPMNHKAIYFTGTNDTGGVSIGFPGNTALNASLQTLTFDTIKKNGISSDFYTSSGDLATTTSGRFYNYGLTNVDADINAVVGIATRIVASPGDATGVIGAAGGTGYLNMGGRFSATGGTNSNIGVFASAPNSTNDFAGVFVGNVLINGPATGFVSQIYSDKNIKTNVTGINSSLDIINKLKPVSFKYNNSYAPQLRVDNNLNYGFIAQEVGNILPTLTRTVTIPETRDSLGNVTNPAKSLITLNYDGLIPFAISGIQELNTTQQEIKAILDKSGLSDAQVKTNVNTFNALAKIKTLQPVQYNFTNANVPQLTFKPNADYGFVAQQLETVYPELVDTLRIDATYDSLGAVVNPAKVLKTINYKAMSGLLVRSIQEQQSTIDSLRTTLSKQDSINNAVQLQLANLAAMIDGCCHANSRTSNNSTPKTDNSLDIELSDKDAIVLNQNVPNPFAEQTTITYNVPATVGKAQLIFFNTNGQVIQTVDIKTRGKGKINVFASDLSSGLYNYSLVADGKVIDSKKMVRE